MINFPKTGFLFNGVDLIQLFIATFNMLIDKGIITENELAGYLMKAGFKMELSKPQAQHPAVDPEIDLTTHAKDCLCEECQKERGLQ